MKKNLNTLAIVLLFIGFASCQQQTKPTVEKSGAKKFHQYVVAEENLTPTVDIKNFTLICEDSAAVIADAKSIMKVKRNFPLAMQRKDSALFEQIMAEGMTFHASYEFYNRKDLIQNRIHSTWTIDTVRYEDLVLQFIDNRGLLTYHNTLYGTDDYGKPDIEKYWWADVYVKENGVWKIEAVHEIDSKIEYPGKN